MREPAPFDGHPDDNVDAFLNEVEDYLSYHEVPWKHWTEVAERYLEGQARARMEGITAGLSYFLEWPLFRMALSLNFPRKPKTHAPHYPSSYASTPESQVTTPVESLAAELCTTEEWEETQEWLPSPDLTVPVIALSYAVTEEVYTEVAESCTINAPVAVETFEVATIPRDISLQITTPHPRAEANSIPVTLPPTGTVRRPPLKASANRNDEASSIKENQLPEEDDPTEKPPQRHPGPERNDPPFHRRARRRKRICEKHLKFLPTDIPKMMPKCPNWHQFARPRKRRRRSAAEQPLAQRRRRRNRTSPVSPVVIDPGGAETTREVASPDLPQPGTSTESATLTLSECLTDAQCANFRPRPPELFRHTCLPR